MTRQRLLTIRHALTPGEDSSLKGWGWRVRCGVMKSFVWRAGTWERSLLSRGNYLLVVET
jgi:hypothetical protein